ncbi:MAG: M6 family metalloprotease domain-containing protein, partial [Muribaculaceae bacterium]|nr:M6 family metalloprotease domain-containing protein [Muribaculaceae bacterium]
LVEFQDQKFALNIGDPKERITEMLNGDNYTFQGAEGSAREFYRYTSAGKFTPKFNVVGPVVCSKNEVEYVTPSEKDYLPGSTTQECYPASRMIEEAVKLVDDEIDFSKYDMDSDGFVDFVYVFFAGRGATTGGNSKTTIWPHAFTLTAGIGAPVELDGVKINRYCCSAETGSKGKLSGIGTFCHEFGHVLGLPDLYDTANNGQVSKCFTPGSYDCMDAGNYNNSEHTPATFSIYEQYALEWTKPVEITGSANITMIPLAARPFGYKVNTNRAKTEYFMLENRGPIANDYYLEGHGMLAWHIDFNLDAWTRNVPNNLADHQRIDIEEADASPDISSRAGDVFPGTAGVHEFQSFGRPGFCDWDYEGTGYEITEIIRHADGTISFKVTADEGNEMTEARIGTPVAEVVATSATTATLKWQPVDNADSYMVSVYDPSLFDGNLLKDYVEGYCFKSVGDATTTEITGLEPGKHYAAFVYALNEYNASRTPM